MTPSGSDYDRLPFVSRPSPERHVNRLAAVARLAGMEPAPVDCCRVLELGSGNGANLIPMALSYPRSRFLGVDLAAGPIEAGRSAAAAAGAENIELRCQSFLDFTPDGDAAFDYIICHGVFSWVAGDVRERILAVCAAGLAPQGIACISYNSLPGWSMRAQVRAALRAADRPAAPLAQRIADARGRMALMLETLADDGTPYGAYLRYELEHIAKQSDAYLLHELLAPHVHAFYLNEFLAASARHGLQFLGEARFSRNLTTRLLELPLSAERRALLAGREGAVEAIEQQLDFVFPTVLRATLLARAAPPHAPFAEAADLMKLSLASPLVPFDPLRRGPQQAAEFVDPRGYHVEIKSAAGRAALRCLHQAWPAAVAFEELRGVVANELQHAAPTGEDLAREMLGCCRQDLIELFTLPPVLAPLIGERPCLSPYARLQLRDQNWATSQRHDYLVFDEFQKAVALLLNGRRTRTQVAQELTAVMPDDDLRELARTELEKTLELFRAAGFLLPQEAIAGSSASR